MNIVWGARGRREETGQDKKWGRLYTGQENWACCRILGCSCSLVSLTTYLGLNQNKRLCWVLPGANGKEREGCGKVKAETLESSCRPVTSPGTLQQPSLPGFAEKLRRKGWDVLLGKSGEEVVPLESCCVWVGLAGLVLHSKLATHSSVAVKMTQPCWWGDSLLSSSKLSSCSE